MSYADFFRRVRIGLGVTQNRNQRFGRSSQAGVPAFTPAVLQNAVY